MVIHGVKHVVIACIFYDMYEHEIFIIQNVVIIMMLCSHDDMRELSCGLLSMRLRCYGYD